MRIAILDSVPEIYWADDEGITDAEKFVDLLAPINPEAIFDIFYVCKDEFPASIDEYQGLLLTGSPASVHDDFDWIKRLSILIKQADEKNKRMVASCFGHQLVAKTFGGEVGRNEGGWMIGHYSLDISQHYDWMGEETPQTGLYHFNQERVTRLPQAAQSFAASEDYPDFAYILGDNIFCLQGHPEQPRRAMNNFLAATADQMDQSAVEKARTKIDDGEPDSRLWGEWMMRFFIV